MKSLNNTVFNHADYESGVKFDRMVLKGDQSLPDSVRFFNYTFNQKKHQIRIPRKKISKNCFLK